MLVKKYAVRLLVWCVYSVICVCTIVDLWLHLLHLLSYFILGMFTLFSYDEDFRVYLELKLK